MADIALVAASIAPVFVERSEIISGVATEAITPGQILYRVAATGKFGIADANAAGKQQARGIALEAAGAGQALSILKRGYVYGYTVSALNNDALLYLSDTAGALADAAGTMTVRIGRVESLSDTPNFTKVVWFDAGGVTVWS